MQGYRSHADTYYVLDELQTQPGGYLGEGISCPDTSGEFELLREGYFGVVSGHDHRNGFVGEHEGLLLIATPTCGFNTYGPAPAKRATRLIEFDIRHPYEPLTQAVYKRQAYWSCPSQRSGRESGKRNEAPNRESACRRKGRSRRQKMEPGA